MKRIAILLAALCLILTGCAAPSAGTAGTSGSGTADAKVQTITPEKARERMESGEALMVLDVRTAKEYAEGHIPGAYLLPDDEIGQRAAAELPVTDAEVLVYCRTGVRSAAAAEELAKMGYTNVYDLGGITDWPYETEKGEWEKKTGTFASFRTVEMNGAPVDESIFKDHTLTMVNIWATFCSPCLREMPDLAELNREYADKGFQIVGLPIDVLTSSGAVDMSQVETARSLAEKTGADYRHLLPSSDLGQALNEVSVVPTTYFVDSEGNVVGQGAREGSMSKENWAALIEDLLAQQGA